MTTVTTHEAKTTLSRLIERALAGERVVICRGAHPQVELIPVAKPARPDPLQTYLDLACEITCDLTAPLSEDEWPEASR